MQDFLPKNHKEPEIIGKYMKFKQGDNSFRVMSPAITGYQYWNNEGKPVRMENYPDELPKDIQLNEFGNPTELKYFWAFIVWNYKAGTKPDGTPIPALQILEIDKKKIREPIEMLYNNKKWGNPTGYDITVTRTGTTKTDTRYSVNPDPHSPIPKEASEAVKNKHINALFEGKDPFALSSKAPTERADYPEEKGITPEEIPF